MSFTDDELRAILRLTPSLIPAERRFEVEALAQALLEERQASKTLARAILDAPHGEDCATYLPQLTDPCICWKAAATELARRVVGDGAIKESKPAILARLKAIGGYTSIISGHGDSDHGLWFSEDYGEVDKLLEYIYGR